MPLLPSEPSLFPTDLFDAFAEAHLEDRWWVLHTRPRAEKALARRLCDARRAFFLPLRQHQWHIQGRLRCSYLPLFPSYLFLLADRETVIKALETNLVARVLPVPDQQQLHSDLERIHHLIAAGVLLVPEAALKVGTAVEIVAGPLTGLRGKILRCGKNLRFVVEVCFLQQGVSAEVESWMIAPRAGSRAVSA